MDHQHSRPDSLVGRKTSYAENYPQAMVEAIANCIMAKEQKYVIFFLAREDDLEDQLISLEENRWSRTRRTM
jgi:hypothetical protein